MRTFLMVIVISGLTIIRLTAQSVQPENSREIYFSMDPIGSKAYGMQYKTGLNENTMLRFAFSSFNAAFSSTRPALSYNYPSTQLDIGGGLEAGLEKRVLLTEKVSAFYGVDFVAQMAYTHQRSDNPTLPEDIRALNDVTLSPGFGFKSGLLLHLKNGFFAAVELSPRLFYQFSSDEQRAGNHVAADRHHTFGFNADVEAMKISLAYRWHKSVP
ncbi:MAG TPA: hypothetical protein ENO20_12085 [Bacteroides sp.]|nr:hypothetical protein [Bacteroides sp.]